MHITAICNQKGGVGKTTTVINLARALAAAGKRVLVIDLDDQGAASLHFLGLEAEDLASLHAVIGNTTRARELIPIADAISSTSVSGLDIVPGHSDLELLAADLVSAGIGREQRLARALAGVKDAYDHVLIDCPPTLSLLTINGLVAANASLVVTEPEYFSTRAVGKLLDVIDQVTERLNPSHRVLGVLINKYDATNSIHRERLPQIRAQYQGDPTVPRVLDVVVPAWTLIGRTADTGSAVTSRIHPATARASDIYTRLAGHLDRAETGA